MGEIADAIIEGEICDLCGAYLGEEGWAGDSPGYPRRCDDCIKEHGEIFIS